MSHCIVHMVQNNAILLQYSLDLEHFHILLSLNSFSFSPNSVFVCVCVCVCVRACVCVCTCVRVWTYYHVYRSNSWKTLVIHQPVQVSNETNAISRAYDPYCCKIVIIWWDWVGVVTVDRISHKLLQFVYYFLQEGGSATVTVVSIQYWMSHLYQKGGWSYQSKWHSVILLNI